MCILVVENNLTRQEWFRRQYAGCVVVATCEAAVAALRGRVRFGVVFLDYDLDGVGTGGDVAFWMATEVPRQQRPKQVFVHSANTRGGMECLVTLRAAGFTAQRVYFPPGDVLEE